MFNTDRFIEDCRSALTEDNAHAAVKEIVARAGRTLPSIESTGRAKISCNPNPLPLRQPNDPQRFVGAVHAFVSAQPSDVGGHRHL